MTSIDDKKTNADLVAIDQAERQAGNQEWWTDNTMSYDWKSKAPGEPFSDPWFDDIDRRFLFGARLFSPADNPFVELMDLGTLAGKRVLEIGCGMGMHSEMLLKAGAKLTSIDISPTSAMATTKRLALRGLPGDVRQMDAEKLEFPDATFDLVWSWGVIHHSSNTTRVLSEIARVLKPGGEARIMVYALDGMSAYITLAKYMFGFWRGRNIDEMLWRDADGFTARFYTKDNWRDLLSLFFTDTVMALKGQDADAVPLPRQLRMPLLKLFSTERLRAMAAKRGSMLFSVSRKR
ncbi:MAG: class I SAM-dependent methyltransferase [Sphingomonas sp.]|uniref:class I SAM-dependent methyltransferase n=1 Tax=Sphingomonas sp. TaxID=28214 RepID=UPI00120CFD1A|nr:class I SAM-dependent methyltransferase [Sphingomonas sp.]THD37769.1 MAG: class I SAM-dependent methyltransferase [Sphingomonas sp.]